MQFFLKLPSMYLNLTGSIFGFGSCMKKCMQNNVPSETKYDRMTVQCTEVHFHRNVNNIVCHLSMLHFCNYKCSLLLKH